MKKIEKIIIVGTDEIALLVAATLSFNLRHVDIALVASAHKNPSGFVESSMGNINALLTLAGVDVDHFVVSTQAIVKLGNRFQDWTGNGHKFPHCFAGYGDSSETTDFYQAVVRFNKEGKTKKIDDFSLAARVAQKGIPYAGWNAASGMAAGLHFAIPAFIQYFSQHIQRLGVTRFPDHVNKVLLADDGSIAALVTDTNQELTADFYIDCSGSTSQLLGDAMGVGYIDWQGTLKANRKLCAIETTTESASLLADIIASPLGWLRRVRLRNVIVSEFYYRIENCTDDQARAELNEYVDSERVKVLGVTSHLPGRRRKFWASNCLAVGQAAVNLADFSHSPLSMAQAAITRFLDYFPSRTPVPELVDEYNRLTANEIDNIYDYHCLHYWLLNKSHPLSIGSDKLLSNQLRNRLAVFQACGKLSQYEGDNIDSSQWLSLLLGMNIWPERYDPLLDNFSSAQLDQNYEKMNLRFHELISSILKN